MNKLVRKDLDVVSGSRVRCTRYLFDFSVEFSQEVVSFVQSGVKRASASDLARVVAIREDLRVEGSVPSIHMARAITTVSMFNGFTTYVSNSGITRMPRLRAYSMTLAMSSRV